MVSSHDTPHSPAWRLVKDSTFAERSWQEDMPHENGNYHCICCDCGRTFQGHKRRVLCKVCTDFPCSSASEIESPLQGTWPKGDPRRAFVEGAKWWLWQESRETMFGSEVDAAEREANKRYKLPPSATREIIEHHAPSRSASERRSSNGLNTDAGSYQVGEAHPPSSPSAAASSEIAPSAATCSKIIFKLIEKYGNTSIDDEGGSMKAAQELGLEVWVNRHEIVQRLSPSPSAVESPLPNRAPEPAQADQGPRSGAHQERYCSCGWPNNPCSRTQTDCLAIQPRKPLDDKKSETPRCDHLHYQLHGYTLEHALEEFQKLARDLEPELAAWKDRADRVIKERDILGRELAYWQDECAKQVKATEEARDIANKETLSAAYWKSKAEAAPSSIERKITKHAQIGSTVFHPGIAVQTVIDRAYREYEYQQLPENEALRMAKAEDFRKLLAQPSAIVPTLNERRYEWLRVKGCALDGSDAQRDGLVRRCINLDEEIDKAMRDEYVSNESSSTKEK